MPLTAFLSAFGISFPPFNYTHNSVTGLQPLIDSSAQYRGKSPKYKSSVGPLHNAFAIRAPPLYASPIFPTITKSLSRDSFPYAMVKLSPTMNPIK